MITAIGTPNRSPFSRSSVASSLFSKATLASPPMSTRKSSASFASATMWTTSSTLAVASCEVPVKTKSMMVVWRPPDTRSGSLVR